MYVLILNAILAAIMLVIVTTTIRDWVTAIREMREEARRRRERLRFYK